MLLWTLWLHRVVYTPSESRVTRNSEVLSSRNQELKMPIPSNHKFKMSNPQSPGGQITRKQNGQIHRSVKSIQGPDYRVSSKWHHLSRLWIYCILWSSRAFSRNSRLLIVLSAFVSILVTITTRWVPLVLFDHLFSSNTNAFSETVSVNNLVGCHMDLVNTGCAPGGAKSLDYSYWVRLIIMHFHESPLFKILDCWLD